MKTNENSGARFEGLLNGNKNFPDEISSILLDHQEECLRQVELQFRTGAYRFSFGLLHPSLIDKLEVSNEQQAKIKKIAKRFEGEVAAFSEEAKIQFADLMRTQYLDTLAILNNDQLAR